MMKKQKINLPRTAEDGTPYISYSQISSFNSDIYKQQYILSYLFGIKDNGNDYSRQGNAVGEYLEDGSKKENKILNEQDKIYLDSLIERFSKLQDAEYEKLIDIKRDGYKIIGYIDLYYKNRGKAGIIDFKCCNIVKKKPVFVNEEKDVKGYMQTNLYSYAVEQQGDKIGNVGIFALDRVGNAFNGEELHLSGKTETIPVPYDKELTKEFLKFADDTVFKISSLKSTYDSLKNLEIEF